MHKPEILAPAGDMTCLQAALDAGADAVYLGLEAFNMRARASVNLTRAELPEASKRCRARGVKLYLVLNTIVFEGELAAVEDMDSGIEQLLADKESVLLEVIIDPKLVV